MLCGATGTGFWAVSNRFMLLSGMSTQWGLYAAASILVSIPVVIVFMVLSRYLISGITLGAVKE